MEHEIMESNPDYATVVGYALKFGIKTYREEPGLPAKSLEELTTAVRAEEDKEYTTLALADHYVDHGKLLGEDAFILCSCGEKVFPKGGSSVLAVHRNHIAEMREFALEILRKKMSL